MAKQMVVLLMMMMIMMVGYSESSPSLHKVGSKKGWIPNFNYTPWSSHQTFYVGDWLLFVFDKRYYNVLEVNKTSYEVCNEQGFIKNVTRGGRDVVELKEPKPYYFMSGGGYCWGGMKVEVNVVKSFQTAPAPAPAPQSNAAAAAAPLISFIMALAALFASPIFFALF